MGTIANDHAILEALACGVLRVDLCAGFVYATRSNNPARPAGSLTKKGYLRTTFTLKGSRRQAMNHRVVWISVHDHIDSGLEVNHINGRKDDNRPENLEAVTPLVNICHAKETGLLRPRRGIESGHARLSAQQIEAIKLRTVTGESSGVLAAEFGVSRTHIRHIVTGRRWTPNQTFRSKAGAGRLLDGRTHDALPGSAAK